MQKRNLTKDKIIQESAQLAEKIGIENLSLKKVAEHLHISSPSLYNHIKDLNDLKIGLSLLLMKHLGERIGAATIGRSAGEAIMAMAQAYYSFAKENPELYKTILWMPYLNKEILERGKHLSQMVNLNFQAYGLNHEQTTHKARELRSMMHGFISLEHAGYFKNDVAVSESYERMIKDFINQLGKRSKTQQ
ncbi:TetR/AcrR family transcriptional regulator [Sporolactobacillus pectinivorans]|uniref:TetR/AcrR family transcriptional regulator n=1 Tax=Sporolactobacillus pectinivorans TaxID=1591408 RepID=UPI000C260A4D|nr:TetR/AcrR family transcriptional regulator [Sporolactobacillus pectinivorans]